MHYIINIYINMYIRTVDSIIFIYIRWQMRVPEKKPLCCTNHSKIPNDPSYKCFSLPCVSVCLPASWLAAMTFKRSKLLSEDSISNAAASMHLKRSGNSSSANENLNIYYIIYIYILYYRSYIKSIISTSIIYRMLYIFKLYIIYHMLYILYIIHFK